jgi:FtsP/CotA-like multicopper oxidase with cupredoxin domain
MSRLRSSRKIGVGVFAAVPMATAVLLVASGWPLGATLDSLEVRARDGVAVLTLTATTDATTGRSTWLFNGRAAQPVIRVSPGDSLAIHYVNALAAATGTREQCAVGPCMNMTNLHFHGLSVSPNRPQDDVLDVAAMPGKSVDYTVNIPLDHPPGLDWYHTHPHGESQRQVLDGLSGALVIEGIERYVPQVRTLAERVLVLRGIDIEHDPNGQALRSKVAAEPPTCSSGSHEQAERVFTVNGALRPRMAWAPDEQQFWRIVNAAADRYVDLELTGGSFDIVALDGMPLAYHDPQHLTRRVDHVLVPPAGRVEAIVNGPRLGAPSVLRTRCVDTGPDGDANPAMVLADVDSSSTALVTPFARVPIADTRTPTYKVVDVGPIQAAEPAFVLTFTEDHNGFYINDRKFAPDAAPMVRAKVGEYQHWRIVNATRELHPFHIHQTHFLAYLEGGRPMSHPDWLDTVNVPAGSSVDAVMDFTDPIIRGMSLFHCHLLNHEDKGMMAKILFE